MLSLSPARLDGIYGVFLGFLLVASVVWWTWFGSRRAQSPLPPKIGFGVDKRPQWIYFFESSRLLGPLLSLSSGISRRIIIVNGLSATIELFEARSSIYCTRPFWTMAKLIGRQNNVAFTPYGPQLRLARKLLHKGLGPRSREQWGALLQDQVAKSIERIDRGVTPLKDIIKEHISDTITTFVYGKPASEEFVRLSESVNFDTGLSLMPGRWLVDSFPILQYFPSWLPGMGFKRWALKARRKFESFVQTPYDEAIRENSGMHSSFVSQSLKGLAPEEQPILRSTAGSLYGAGTDTMIALTQSALFLLACHPDIQDRLLAEISSHPQAHLSDLITTPENELPFLTAVIMEVHRFRPAVSIINHSPLKDDIYDGYRIPKGSQVGCNVWSICHDGSLYSNPSSFDPSRFMDASTGRLSASVRDPRSFTYGFGRRRCPGEHFANAHLGLFLASIITRFEITLGKETLAMDPGKRLEYTNTFISSPAHFDVQLRSREA